MRAINKLTVKEVDNLSKPGLYADGLGLYLQVAVGGSKSWIFRFMKNGKAKKMGLGSVNLVSLKEARDKAFMLQRKLMDGTDPIKERDAERLAIQIAEAKAMSFEDCASTYISSHRAGWKNAKHADQWQNTLSTYVFPQLGKLPVAEVDVGLVMKVLRPIWTEKPETATRVRGRIEAILDWATAHGYRTGDNPARWKGHLDKLLPKRQKVAKVKHHAALAYSEIASFMSDLRAMEGVSPKALEFAILTATRSGETLGALWSEIDMDNALWVIPGSRMKAEKDHRVPLSKQALEILRNLPREDDNPYVFIGNRGKGGLSSMALLMTLRRMEREDLTVHGFRSTFRDWAAEQTAYPNEMLEMALAHTVSDKTEAAYRRGDMKEKRQRLMTDWADYCDKTAGNGNNVVTIRSAAHG
ncbi:integrase arm-type DNA-binding domain-containing protein [Sinorhizobium fredii]|uniref:tyrosine-type recombinase/integrase n=1 Tax=Rhizobium fredii TaxID=380 RepID=UPI0030A551E5